MDDGDLDVSNEELFSRLNTVGSCSMDGFFEELLNDNQTCTHTHTCNPPGHDYSHTHTCFHMHTKILPAPSEEKVSTDDTAESSEKKAKKRPLGNREAVRKYREKKKAKTASLEDEVVRLKALNQQLFRKLQGQATLEAEVARLKCLLVDIRGRIEGEIGSFPYQKSANASYPLLPGSYMVNPCNMEGNNQVYCLQNNVEDGGGEGVSVDMQGFNGCDFEQLQCLVNQNAGRIVTQGAGEVWNAAHNANVSRTTTKKGKTGAAKAV